MATAKRPSSTHFTCVLPTTAVTCAHTPVYLSPCTMSLAIPRQTVDVIRNPSTGANYGAAWNFIKNERDKNLFNQEQYKREIAEYNKRNREAEAQSNLDYEMRRKAKKGNLRGTTRVAPKTPSFRRTKRSRFQVSAEAECSKFTRRYRPLAARRRRRYKRRKLFGYDRSFIPDFPSIETVTPPSTVGNMPFFTYLGSVNPLDATTYFLPGTSGTQFGNQFAHLNFKRVGSVFEFVNSNSFPINIRIIFGKDNDLATDSLFRTFCSTIPPQINNPMTIKQYTTFWYRIEGKRFIKLGAGARTKLSISSNFGLRRIDNQLTTLNTNDRIKLLQYHIQAWPDLSCPAQAFATETSEGLAYPKMNAFSFMKQSFYNIGYPEQLSLRPTETRTSIAGLGTVLSTVEVKAENVMTSATT